MDVDRKVLENQLLKYQGIEKEKRLMNERIVDLEDQIKKLTDSNNGMNYKQLTLEEEVDRLKNQIGALDRKGEEMKGKVRDL